MPIRTGRGRSAVYRQVWGWPLRSPRHLAAALVGLLAVAVAVATVLAALPDPGQRSGPAAADELPADREAPAGAGAPRPAAPPEALSTARKWAQAWVTHPDGITVERWTEQLRPHTTEEYLPLLRSVDPANVPSRAVTGPPRAVSATARSVQVDVPTDGALLRLTVIRTAVGWRVAGYERAG